MLFYILASFTLLAQCLSHEEHGVLKGNFLCFTFLRMDRQMDKILDSLLYLYGLLSLALLFKYF